MIAFIQRSSLAALLIAMSAAAASLSDDDRKLLQDPGGWEYLSLSDSQNGFPTKHSCFDGKPHPKECSGNLTLREDGHFTQTTLIKGQSVERKGRYELSNNQLEFFDELETKDGPYTLTLNREAKSLKIEMRQVTVELMLASEYRARLKAGKL